MEYKTRIEVATHLHTPSKIKGDLLEGLAEDLLRIQNYKVTNQVRVTATELDLLCEHQVNRKIVYVECKAHRDPISAKDLTNLLGTLTLKDYQEGWFISTGPLGKDAKGFQHDWEKKPESQKLSIYTPERVIEVLKSSGRIKQLPYDSAVETVGNEDQIGDPTLLITKYGVYWTIACLEGGVPAGVLVYSTKTGNLVKEQALLRNLAQTDSSQNGLDFEYVLNLSKSTEESSLNRVIEVEHGASWADYRPARPQDFVGRKETQKRIIDLLEAVRTKKSNTRVFAIKGDSGLGKSSLIAKLRDRVRNQHNRRKFFMYAVDVRAATGAIYVLWSVLACLRKASEEFGIGNPDELRISNSANPFESPSIQEFLTQLEQKKQVICLVFDQFEELYSKPEAFAVFDATQNLLLSAVAEQSSLVLGFAWKTDSTVQQDHPAYYMWHRLADHRMAIELGRFTSSEASRAISIFQKELGEQLRPDLRRQLIENSQGYPWLLKKLCIHVYDSVRSGISQSELLDKALDIESLFDKDLQMLTPSERTCLKMIAENAPVDWYEILEVSGQEVLRGLQDKRLIIRSGDRFNLYWDIFREYVRTQTVPSIALSYLPSSPSISALIKVAIQLDSAHSHSHAELSKLCGFTEKTIGNVIRDLNMFRMATVEQSKIRLDLSMEAPNQESILQKLRQVLKSHALTMELSKQDPEVFITTHDIIQLLKRINPTAQHQEKTWKLYAERMEHWLFATGYLVRMENDWKFEVRGKVNPEHIKKTRKITIFIGDTSPAKAVEALDYIRISQPLSIQKINKKKLRNAARTLRGLGLVKPELGTYAFVGPTEFASKSSLEVIWAAACDEKAVKSVIYYLKEHPTVDGQTVGEFVNQEFNRDWSVASKKRVGNGLRQWALWVMNGMRGEEIPEPPGRTKNESRNQLTILGLEK